MSIRQEPSRRQVKVARIIRESVSDSIAHHLSDPRITGLVSVTSVDVAPDMKNAAVSLSILAADEKARRLTLAGIKHAGRRIQTILARKMTTKFCPHLTFCEDEILKKTLDTLNIIDEVSKEFKENDAQRELDEEIE